MKKKKGKPKTNLCQWPEPSLTLSFWEDNGAVVYLQVLISLIWNDVTTPFAFTVICAFT